MKSTARRVAALFLVGSLAACAGQEPTPDHFYRVDVPPAATLLERPLFPGIVEVAPLIADGLVSERAIVYLYADQPSEIHQYSYRFWNTPPAVLVQEQLLHFLRGAHLAERVVSTDLRLPADVSVEGRVRRFEQVFTGKDVRMVVDLDLAVIRGKDEGLTLLKDYHAEKPAQDDSLPAAAAAASEALSEIFNTLLNDLRAGRRPS